ncbi:MAG: site-specific DNA-methyltransferase [Bacillota bacterium]|nr:site-specific DNA-methyltransferase [Bacillota bacterium]
MKNKSNVTPHLVWENKSEQNKTETFLSSCVTHQKVFVHPYAGKVCEIDCQKDDESKTEMISNRLFWGDNISFLQDLYHHGYREKIKLIYIDPPYCSQMNYQSEIQLDNGVHIKRNAFDDRWSRDINDYLNMLYPRLQLMRELLKEEGSIFVHVDWHCSHYVRVLLDEIFGKENFVNEIVWCYGGGGRSKRTLMRKHDLIYWYAKTDKYTYNPLYRPYTEGTLQRGLTRVKGDQYKLRAEGAAMQDWWTDINKILSPTARENLKYPTQKPEALVRRIVEAASDPGDLVADFFAGSGTTANVCDQLNRNWLLSDESDVSKQTILYRLIQNSARPFRIDTHKDKIVNDSLFDASLEKQKDGSFILSLNAYHSNGKILSGQDLNRNLEFWEVDFNFDHSIFCSHIQIVKNKPFKDVLPIEFCIRCNDGGLIGRPIAIRIHDVWGQEATTWICL